MKAAEIRQSFLSYFERHGHAVVESSSLVPHNDPTLLFTNAGMNQFKDVFLGKEKRPYTRATTSQKCVRAGGKHNDLENVGFTARHHTFFEMLGNFSFGDYFKHDAIRFAWGFVTNELKLPKDRLYVTVFREDDEAADIWHQQEGVPKDRIFRMGEKDNFWQMGDTGPCGPCTELFIDRGAKYGCGQPNCTVGCDCDRYMEFWNLVFMQYDRQADGTLQPLPRPSVDTGAGLERIASIMQSADSNYETDLFQELIQRTAKLAGVAYDITNEKTRAAFRVIADHARASTFLISDGVIPSNEGRGYVLRRIIRRAIRMGKTIGFEAPFLHKVCGFVVEQMSGAYPDLKDKATFVGKAVAAEEEQFYRTLEKGLSLLDDETAKLPRGGVLRGDIAFKLYDTFGFPLDLTRVILRERHMDVDEEGFETSMEQQRAQSRKNWKGSGEESIAAVYHRLADTLRDQGKSPEFVGYESESTSGKVMAIISKGGAVVDAFTGGVGAEVEVVFDRTPFYGESGGQLGDQGRVTSPGFAATVLDTQRPVPSLISLKLRVERGAIRVGEIYQQEVAAERRALTKRNHTATHLLHWALRKVLGDHVKQAGSLVGPDILRFDFAHFQGVSAQELRQVEDLVNEQIWLPRAVQADVMDKEQAIESGAIAFFGEKYGDKVRVLRAGDHSVELCGGTHVSNTSEIQLFKIVTEGAIAAGVRRITAMTSAGAFAYLREREEETRIVRGLLKAGSADEAVQKIEKMAEQEKAVRRELEKMQSAQLGNEIDQLLNSAPMINGTALISAVCPPNSQGVKALREMADRLRQKNGKSVVILGMALPDEGKAFLLAAVGKDAPTTVKANELINKFAPMIEGRGGGKPDLAQAGGTQLAGLERAVAEAKQAVTDLLRS